MGRLPAPAPTLRLLCGLPPNLPCSLALLTPCLALLPLRPPTHPLLPPPAFPLPRSSGSAFDVLKANFDASYAGNRAPFPLFTHSPYLEDNMGDLQRFIGELFF